MSNNKNADLLRQVKDEVAKGRGFKSWDQISVEYTEDGIDQCLCEVAQRYAERYHVARIAELGECFTEDDVNANIPGMHLGSVIESFTSYLNTRAAEYAAGKVAELQQWKESALKVLDNINLQEVGKELGLKLGEDVSPRILTGIRDMKEKMAGMLKLLDDISDFLTIIEDSSHGPHSKYIALLRQRISNQIKGDK